MASEMQRLDEKAHIDVAPGKQETSQCAESDMDGVLVDTKPSIANNVHVAKSHEASLDSSMSYIEKAIKSKGRDVIQVIVNWLTEEGGDVQHQNEDGATVLHFAVLSLNVELVQVLLDHNADPNVVDQEEKTALHYLCALPTDKNIFEVYKLLEDKIADVNALDDEQCTPLSYAAENGHLEVVKKLLDKGADLESEDDIGDTPVHKAAYEGHTSVLAEFIKRDPECIHLTGYNNETLLHHAVLSGKVATVELVLKHNQHDINTRSQADETPLHAVAINGNIEIAELLLKEGADVNPLASNRYTKSPFHKAAYYGHSELAEYLLNNGADVTNVAFKDIISEGYETIAKLVIKRDQWPLALRGTYRRHGQCTTAFRELVVRMPDVAKLVLDRCTVENPHIDQRNDKDYSVIFNYEFIEDVHDQKDENLTTDSEAMDETDAGARNKKDAYRCGYEEIRHRHSPPSWGPSQFSKNHHPLQIMVENKQLELLTHPVTASLLHYKWRKFGLAGYLINLFSYIVFLAFLTVFALTAPNPQIPQCLIGTNSTGNGSIECPVTTYEVRNVLFGSSIIVLIVAITRILFEIVQFSTRRLSYIKSPENLLEMIQYICTVIFVWVYHNQCLCPLDWQWQVGVVALFLGWINLILFVSKLPYIGLYVLIFIKIFKTFVTMVVLTMLLILSFGLPFFMVFFDSGVVRSPFSDVSRSLLKVMTMATGELDFDAIFRLDPSGGSDNTEEIKFPPISYILWIMFIVFIPVILMNMLTSLAIGDTEEVRRKAELTKLAQQVDQALSMEEFVVAFRNCLPKEWERTKQYQVIYPNKNLSLRQKLGFKLWEGVHYDDISVIQNVVGHSNSKESVIESTKEMSKRIEKLEYTVELLVKENDKKTSDILNKMTSIEEALKVKNDTKQSHMDRMKFIENTLKILLERMDGDHKRK